MVRGLGLGLVLGSGLGLATEDNSVKIAANYCF